MLLKMLGIQMAWEMEVSGSDMPKPRQIYVTKSDRLVKEVKDHFAKWLESSTSAQYSLEDLKRMQARRREVGLEDADDADGDDILKIPRKYSLLEDQHFPLFVTFDEVIFQFEWWL